MSAPPPAPQILSFRPVISLPHADFDPIATAQPIKRIYVKSTGNDTTGDGTLAKPYLTIPRARLDVPPLLNGTVYVIDLTDYGNYNIAAPLVLDGYVGSSNFDFLFDNAEGNALGGGLNLFANPVTDDLLNLGTMSVVYDSVSGLATITDTSKAWTVNQWKGFLYSDTFTGFGSDTTYFNGGTIVSNTATSLVVASPFVYAGMFGSVPAIAHQSCTINMTLNNNGATVQIKNCLCSVVLTGIKVTGGASGFSSVLSASDSYRVRLTMCNVGGISSVKTRYVSLDQTYAHSPTNSTPNGDAQTVVVGGRLDITSSYLRNQFGLRTEENFGALYIYGCWLEACNAVNSGFTNDPALGSLSIQQTEIENAFEYAVDVQAHANAGSGDSVASLSHVRISGSNGHGIFIHRNAYVSLRDVAGTGNVGYGLVADHGAKVITYGTNISIAGTLGDFKVGARQPRAWAHYFTSAPIQSEADFTGSGASVRDVSSTFSGLFATSSVVTGNGYVPRFYETVRVDPSAGAFAVVLPDPTDRAGQQIKLKNVGVSSNGVTLTATGGKTLDSLTSYVFNVPLGLLTLESDGTNFLVVQSTGLAPVYPSEAEIAAVNTAQITITVVNQTDGVVFVPTRPGLVLLGARITKPAGPPGSPVKVSLWDVNSLASLATISPVMPTGAGEFTVLFATPIILTVGKAYALTKRDPAGLVAWYTTAAQLSTITSGALDIAHFQGVHGSPGWFRTSGCFAAGDAYPATVDTTNNIYLVTPIFGS